MSVWGACGWRACLRRGVRTRVFTEQRERARVLAAERGRRGPACVGGARGSGGEVRGPGGRSRGFRERAGCEGARLSARVFLRGREGCEDTRVCAGRWEWRGE